MICLDEIKGTVRIPIIHKTIDGIETVRLIDFIDNLTVKHAPDYVNENGLMGLTRITTGTYEGQLVLMRYDQRYPKNSYGEFITEKEAYQYCIEKNKLQVAHDLEINFEKEREII